MVIESQKIDAIIQSLSQYLQGKAEALKLALVCFFSGGHLLIEDLPGVGKTTLAISLAEALGLSFGRIQSTSDLLPSDITGLSIYNRDSSTFEFHPGPIFNNIVLVDEINRATPKTQSALLEAMAENQVTIEGNTYKLPQPFFVIATQNPTEQFGTFPLPESQLDRFALKIRIGYPARAAEREILKIGSTREDLHSIEAIMGKEDVIQLQQTIRNTVYLSEKILDYILDIVEETRRSKYLLAGLSTRGAMVITNTAKTHAFFHERNYVVPEDIKDLIEYTVPHRVLFRDEYENLNRKEIVQSIIQTIPTPL
ncbi:MAG: AAA family ATPase [Gemmatimonadetes bacterium]|nr:MAG: AAA family ATPase [Gemmatimonadota bacterium]